MTKLLLPLVESLVNSHPEISLSKVKIIGVQHILETTHAMFQSLYQLGLKPENISIIGKCYSSCKEVFEEMIAEGIDVCPESFSYSSHMSFDELYNNKISRFISARIQDFSSNSYDCIIVLDDGGKFINFLEDYSLHSIPIIAIEQTSSGYEAIRHRSLSFPVINVAKSPVKLTLESPMIAKAAAERLYKSLQEKNLFFDKALIIGGGPIGQALKTHLSTDMNIAIYDQNRTFSDYESSDLPNIIKNFSLIIGCTGKTSISHHNHRFLSPGSSLVSVSSSDREFDAHHLRRLIPEINVCHKDLSIGNLMLINSGFPVNFDGGRENIDPELIQLTIALITAGILQARLMAKKNTPLGIIPLIPSLENKIKEEFLSLYS